MTSVSVLEKRVGEIAAEVQRVLAREITIGDDVDRFRWISTGAGSSEGPARLFATLLRERGVIADYAPISSFIANAPRADACVVVSQRLSPNAQFPLAHAGAYRKMILVTTVDDAPNVHVVQHGPHEEDGLFLRVIGAAAANATIVRLAATHAPPSNLGDVLATARERALAAIDASHVDALFDVVALVAIGADTALVDGLKHKLLEGLGRAVPTLDLCALVHGPLQSFYDRRATLVAFSREPSSSEERSAARELASCLARVLHPERHRVVRLSSSLAGPFALLDFDLQLNHLVLEALRARPRDLTDWPGKGHDSALYDLRPKI